MQTCLHLPVVASNVWSEPGVLKSWSLPQRIPSGNRSLSDLLNLPTKKWVAFHSYVNCRRVTHRRLNHPNPSIWGKLSDIATPNDIKKNRTYSNYYKTLSNFPASSWGIQQL